MENGENRPDWEPAQDLEAVEHLEQKWAAKLNVTAKMAEIFRDHCNLDNYQYAEIQRRLIKMAEGLIEEEWEDVIDGSQEMGVIIEFLFNTKELTLKELNDLSNSVNDMANQAAEEMIDRAVDQLAADVQNGDPRIITNSGVMLD